MINTVEKELIIAYFNGGNAKDIKDASHLKGLLEAIKESTTESKTSREEEPAFHGASPRRNPAI